MGDGGRMGCDIPGRVPSWVQAGSMLTRTSTAGFGLEGGLRGEEVSGWSVNSSGCGWHQLATAALHTTTLMDRFAYQVSSCMVLAPREDGCGSV